MADRHSTVLIVGGGAAGIAVANDLRRRDARIEIALIEPSDTHYYQPGFTIIGGGAYTLDKATRREVDLIPVGVEWIRDFASSFEPDENQVTLRSGATVGYDYLVVCPGLQLDWGRVEGLEDALAGQHNVCSIYSAGTVEYVWHCIRNMRSGKALFTQPPMPIKCAGAPQKIMYLAADRFRRNGTLNDTAIEFLNAGPVIFGVPFFATELAKVAARYGITTSYGHNLVAVDGPGRVATFETRDAEGNTLRVTREFDLLHVTPPQCAPDFIRHSPLADGAGWVEVDHASLQHVRYENIFGLGDATCTPNAKTAAAVRKQVPVVVDNLLGLMQKRGVREAYDGYGSCPLTTSIGRVMLAEFAYGGKVTPSFPYIDPRKERSIWWLGKTWGFPFLYWHIMLKGLRIDLPHRESYAKRYTG